MKHANRAVLRPASPEQEGCQRHLGRMLRLSREIGALSLSPAKRKAARPFKRLGAQNLIVYNRANYRLLCRTIITGKRDSIDNLDQVLDFRHAGSRPSSVFSFLTVCPGAYAATENHLAT